MMTQPDLGKKISELRLAKGLTQGELAEKCNLSLRTIQRIESAEVTPRSYTIRLIFSGLEYEIYDSFGKFTYKLDRSVYKIQIRLGQFYKYFLDLFNLKTNKMRKISTLAAVFSFIGIGLFFITSEGKAQSIEQVKETIQKVNSELIINFNKGEIEPILKFYGKGACLLPQNCCGESCIKQHWQSELAKGYKFVELTSISVSLCDSIAVEKGKWKIAWPSGPEMNGMYLTEWRFSGNQWKMVNDISGIQEVIPENN